MESLQYPLLDADRMLSPSIVVFHDLVVQNIDTMLRIAKDPARLRPHCKTHKMREIVALQVERGVTRHKCATFAEAEMVALAGADDVVLAYNMVGPNIERACTFRRQFPDVAFSVTADHAGPVRELSRTAVAAGVELGVLLDLDTGQHRTGLAPNDDALKLYQEIDQAPGLIANGFHLYDGQNHQTDLDERRIAVQACWNAASALRDRCVEAGAAVPRIVCGGSGSFPLYAELEDEAVELSPGTVIFYDIGYAEMFPDLPFRPAALLLTRVISRPTQNRVTFDLGYKAVASDPPAGRRVRFPEIPDAVEVLQNEEHLVIETSRANEFQPGDWALAIPRHTCPTSALHRDVYVVDGEGRLSGRWEVMARDRQLTV